MGCTVERRNSHNGLRTGLETNPCVLGADTIEPAGSPARRWETEIVLEPEHPVVPDSVLGALLASGCRIRDVSVQGRPGHLIVRVW